MNELIENSVTNKNMQELIKIQNSTINKLKSQIDIYKAQIKELNERISSCDHLIIDYNSLKNNYSKLEKELYCLKKENCQLKSMINSKNKTISEFQFLFGQTKSKFALMNNLNDSLQKKINFLESQIKSGSNNINLNINTDLNDKINDYNLKIKKIKDECNKSEKEFKIQEEPQFQGVGGVSDIMEQRKNFENDTNINELEKEINELKLELNFIKKLNEDLLKNRNDFNEKQLDKLNDIKIKNQELTKENILLKESLNQKDDEYKKIIFDINTENNIKNNMNEKELKEKENIIYNLLNEKENLLKIINDKEAENILLENTFKKKYDILKNIVENIENEKDNIANEKDNNINIYKKEISKLKNEINKCFGNDRQNIERCIEIENKCKNMMENIKNKEDGYKNEINDLKNEIKRLKLEKENNIQRNGSKEDLAKKNKELMKKNNDLTGMILGMRDDFKKIDKNDRNEKTDITNENGLAYTFTCDNTNVCNCCCCSGECIVYDVCCECICHCNDENRAKSFVKK